MDEGGDWRRAGHRVGEPDVKRYLRALACAAEEHEQADSGDEHTARPEVNRLGVHPNEVENADVREQHEHRDEKTKVSNAIDYKCLLTRVRIRLVVEPEPDQQVRAKADTFPADEQHGIIRAKHEDEHEEHEQVEVREIARVPRVVLHVTDTEDVNERPNARDDEYHHHRE